MTGRLSTWLESHYVIVVSSLISSIIICLALLAGLEENRGTHPQAWAMHPDEVESTVAEAPREESPKPSPEEPPEESLEKLTEEPLQKERGGPESREEPPGPPITTIDPLPSNEETGGPGSPVEEARNEPEPVTKPAPAPVEARPAHPTPRKAEKGAVRTLRPRQAPAIRRGRILRPR